MTENQDREHETDEREDDDTRQVSEAGSSFTGAEAGIGGADATDKSTGTAPHEASED